MNPIQKRTPEDADWEKTLVDHEARPLLSGYSMNVQPAADCMPDAVVVWKLLDHLEKAIKAKKEKLRESLLEWAKKLGEPTEKGGQQLVLGSHFVIREKRTANTPEDAALKMLMMGKKMAVTDVYDEVKTLVFNPSKLQSLLDRGVFTPEEAQAIRDMYDETYALRVEASSELKMLLENAKRR